MIERDESTKRPAARAAPGRRGIFLSLRRLRKSEDGVAAIEFAFLAIPFFLILFAIIESCVAYAAEQVLENAVDTMGRKLRTGQITFQVAPDPEKPTDMTEEEFRVAFCDEVDVMLSCQDTTKLFIDVRSFTSFSDIPTSVPRVNNQPFGDLDATDFDFAPGGRSSINVVRAYYKWPVITDLIRPHITNLRPSDDEMAWEYLMVGTSAFRNEAY